MTARKTKGAFQEPAQPKVKEAEKVEVAPLQLVQEPEVVPEGDFAGMTYDEVLAISEAAVDEAIGELTLEGAGAVLDRSIDSYLQVVRHYQGDYYAKLAALKFVSTSMWYAELDTKHNPESKSLKELKKEWKR